MVKERKKEQIKEKTYIEDDPWGFTVKNASSKFFFFSTGVSHFQVVICNIWHSSEKGRNLKPEKQF